MDTLDRSLATGLPRIVIVGAGISGVALASMLAGVAAEVILLEQVIPPERRRVFSGIVSSEDLRALATSPDEVNARSIDRVAHVNLETAGVDTDIFARNWWAVEHGVLLDTVVAKLRPGDVTVVSNATVSGFVWDQGMVAGVRCDDTGQSFAADLVILADESDPRVPEQPGLRPDWMPTELMHLGKVRYPASPEMIRQRLGVSEQGHRLIAFQHRASWDCAGYGLLIPGPDAITLCVAMSLEDEMASARHIREYLDEVQQYPAIQDVTQELTETSFFTEVVPTGGFDARHRFHADRVLVVNDLVGVTNPLNRDGLSANLAVCAAAAVTIREAIGAGSFRDSQLAGFSKRIADEVVGPANAARRTDKSLRAVPAWQWASKPDLVPRLVGVTVGGKSATLPQDNDSGVWKRVRRFGRIPGVRKHAPGEYDE